MQIQSDSPKHFHLSYHELNQTNMLIREKTPVRETTLQLVQTYGYNSTSYFALSKEKQIFVSSVGKSLISYVVQGNCILALGDPIGPEHGLPQALKEFLQFCQSQGKVAAFWQAREELLPLYREQGLHVFKIGEDALLDVPHFTLKGNKMANVRSSMHRAEKERLQIIFFRGNSVDSDLREQMRCISQCWLMRKGGVEMSFSMGHLNVASDDAQLIACAIDEQNQLHAFVSFVPIYGRRGWALDLLRRREDAVPGAMDLLLVRSLEYLKACNAEVLSLGLIPLNNNNQDLLPYWNRWGQALLGCAKGFQQYKTLSFFKQKFCPRWENRYLIFPRRLDLLQVAIGLRQVHYPKHRSPTPLF
ncbi:MAG: DUF2156 domain-containing protein [Ktedonobacteraceae bacterium]|nr:DUF2156 domain-containing protein [Ktedonobacteraceae bacterium]